MNYKQQPKLVFRLLCLCSICKVTLAIKVINYNWNTEKELNHEVYAYSGCCLVGQSGISQNFHTYITVFAIGLKERLFYLLNQYISIQSLIHKENQMCSLSRTKESKMTKLCLFKNKQVASLYETARMWLPVFNNINHSKALKIM
jgi:hypothetical protein